MTDQACPLPTPPGEEESQIIERLLNGHRIAVVGASTDAMKPSHYVPAYLRDHGYEIIPVNPNHPTVFGEVCYPSLAEVPGEIDLVEVFRRALFCPDVVRQAIAVHARGIWLQAGIRSAEAEKLAQSAGIDFVQDRCMMVEHRRRRGC